MTMRRVFVWALAVCLLSAAPVWAEDEDVQMIPDEASYDMDEPYRPAFVNLEIVDWMYENGMLSDQQYDSLAKQAGKKAYFGIRPTGSVAVAFTPYTQVNHDEVIEYPGSPDNERNFSLREAEIGVEGHLYFDWLTYRATVEAREEDKGTYDFGVKYAFVKGAYRYEADTDVAFEMKQGLTIGAMKIPFSRQSLYGSTSLQFIKRSMVVSEMPIRYDIGATYDSQYKVGHWAKFDLRAGAFNGQGDKVYGVDNNDNMQYVGRLRVDLLSSMATGEGDTQPRYWLPLWGFGDSENRFNMPQISVGGSALQNNDIDRVHTAWGADFEFRWSGISLQGEYIFNRFEPELDDPLVGDTYADEWETWGWYAQGGIFVLPRHLEVAARYEEYHLDLLDDVSDQRFLATTTVGINYHFASFHGLKAQANYNFREEVEGMPEIDNDTLTIQVSAQF